MQTTFALVALASVASAAIGSSPSSSAPAGCSASYSTPFQITIINSTMPVAKRASTCGQAGYLTATLKNGILKDSQNRQGEVVANYQFQFDDLLQPDAVYTQGFSVCNNGSLALGGSNIFYQCETSGGPGIGTYSNLYDRSIAPYCQPILINILPCPASAGSTSAVSQVGDGQVQATTVGTAVSQITDGQVQATGTAGQVPVSQISDGQIQVTTAAPGCVVSQISDGQVQFTVCAHPTGAPVSQISDGQVQATATGAPVSQISDGQVQATKTGAPVSQISDGQIQATTLASITTGAPVSQISDGQIQATKAPNATVTPLQVTAAGNGLTVGSTLAAIFVGLAGVLLL